MTNTNERRTIAITALTDLGYTADIDATDDELLEMLEIAERSLCIDGQSILYKQAIVSHKQAVNKQAIDEARAEAEANHPIQRRAKAASNLITCIRDVYSLLILLLTSCLNVVKAYRKAARKQVSDLHMPATVSTVSEAARAIRALGVTGVMDSLFCLN